VPSHEGRGFWEGRLRLIALAIQRYELLDTASRRQLAMRVLAISVTVLGLGTILLLVL